jgi:hypothetical protein
MQNDDSSDDLIDPRRLQSLELIARDFGLDLDDLLELHNQGLELVEYQCGTQSLITARPSDVARMLELNASEVPLHLLKPAARARMGLS